MSLKRFIQKWITFKNLPMINELSKISRSIDLIQRNQTIQNFGEMPLQSVAVKGGLEYIGRTNDECIIPWMKENKVTWACDSIDNFFELVANCNDDNSNESIFLDIGANIGTTSIYVAKNHKQMNVIAFEPDTDNFKILKSNCVLNEVENTVKCENCALSNKSGIQKFIYNKSNPGASHLISDIENNAGTSEVSAITLDEYIKTKNIPIDKICMIWIDTEGYEAEVIEGAQNLLRGRAVPLFMEMNYKEYRKKGMLEKYINNMNLVYTHFIDMGNYSKGEETWIPVDNLGKYIKKMEDNNRAQTDFVFMKREMELSAAIR